MKTTSRPHLLPRLFERRSVFYRSPIIDAETISKLGVDIHPLARTFTVIDEVMVQASKKELQQFMAAGSVSSLPRWLFVGSQLLDAPGRWRACQELGLDPRQIIQTETIDEREALRCYLERCVSKEGKHARRAAMALVITLNYARNFAHLREVLKSPASPRPNITKLLAGYCGVEKRTMSYAIASASNDDLEQFWEVFGEERNSFHAEQLGRGRRERSKPHGTEFRHRIFDATSVAGRKRNQMIPDLALLVPDISADDYMRLKSVRTTTEINDLKTKLERMSAKLATTGFLCLILPPLFVISKDFRDLQDWTIANGFVTRATACARYKAGLERQQVTPGWGFVWVLARNRNQPLYARFDDVLFSEPGMAVDRHWDFILSGILRSFCPATGIVMMENDSADVITSMCNVVVASQVRLIVPDCYLEWMLKRIKCTAIP